MAYERRTVTPAEVRRQKALLREPLGPGVWVDTEGAMHVSVPDILRHFGWPDTSANREMVARVARETMARQNPAANIVEQDVES